jgi:cytochrome c-type biogenesis protein
VAEVPSLTLAFAAGFVSFVSPCCLPLVPGFLATVGGTPGQGTSTAVVLRRSALFVATFSAIFIAFGLTATALGQFLFDSQRVLNQVGGAAIVLMGLLFVASPFVLRLNRDWHLDALTVRAGRGGPIVAGAAFAIAWTPCVGPTLGAILGLAATSSSTGEGAGLLAVYAAGLAVPFLLSALLYDRATSSLRFFRRHFTAVQVTSGALLVVVGVLVFTGELFRLNIEAQRLLDGLGLNFWQSV